MRLIFKAGLRETEKCVWLETGLECGEGDGDDCGVDDCLP